MRPDRPENFWREALALRGAATRHVWPRVLACGAWAAALAVVNRTVESIDLGLEIGPFEFAGAVLGILLVTRINFGYDRWWEARKLWGAIVNQSRDLAIAAL